MQYKILGLTGGIGSGKSVILKASAELGIKVLDADILARKAVEQNSVLKKIKDYFGKDITDNSGKLNRKKLGEIVFNNPTKLLWLEQTIHPIITKMILFEIRKGILPILLEATLLIESKHNFLVDLIVTVVAPLEKRVERIMKRDNLTETEAIKRIEIQHSDEWRIEKSHVIMYNYFDEKYLTELTKQFWSDISSGKPLRKIYK